MEWETCFWPLILGTATSPWGDPGGEILFEGRLATDATKTSDEYGVETKDMLDLFGARVEEIRDCIVASVVPPVFNPSATAS